MIVAGIFALWGVLFLFPPVVRGERAEHNLLRIVKPAGPINRDGSVTEFAHVQEKGEYRLHKLLGMTSAALAALLPIEHEVVYPLTVWAALVTVDAFSRKIGAIDYGGHGAEIMAAEKAGFLGYREAEIARMSDDGDKIGHNVAARLLRWEWLSRIVYALGR